MLKPRHLAALTHVVDKPGCSVLSVPGSRADLALLEQAGLICRARLGRRGRESNYPIFLYPTVAALLVTGHLVEVVTREGGRHAG